MLIPSSRDDSATLLSDRRFSCQLDTSQSSKRTIATIKEAAFQERVASSIKPSGIQEAGEVWQPSSLQVNADSESKGHDFGAPAAPLMPLTERDVKALSDFFERDNAEEIQSEVNNYLRLIYPEPCWGDNPFDFLEEYL